MIRHKESEPPIVFEQDTTKEYPTGRKVVSAYLNYKYIERVNTPIGRTLAARDYKGFGTGNETMNGIIEKL